MSDPTATSESDEDQEMILPEAPFMHIDYRVFEMTVQGSSDDNLEDVDEVMQERLKQALEQIEDLKRTDFQLDEEFDIDRSTGGGPSFS